jgi:cytochrome b561
MLRNSRDAWGSLARFFHWSVALLVLVQVALGLTASGWRLSPLKLDLFVWHKSLGFLILLLVVLRLLWRLANPTPALPDGMSGFERLAARASHGLFYLLLVVLPINGWVINSAANVPFSIFWLIPLPAIVAPDRVLAGNAANAHYVLFSVLTLLVMVHAGAALRHHFVKHDSVLRRMLRG